MTETRQIWLVTKDGVPQYCAWASVKTFAEAPEGKKSWAAALDEGQLIADGWDATPTQWRRVPHFVRPGAIEQLAPTISGREVLVGGLRYDMDTGGRAHPEHTDASPREHLMPDAVVDDEDTLLAAAETLNVEVAFTEKTTLKEWRASPTADAALGSEDVLIHRVSGAKTRSDRPS